MARAIVARSGSRVGNEDLVIALFLLGSDYRHAGRYREAKEQLQAALATLRDNKLNADDPFTKRAVTNCLTELADIEIQIGDPATAKELSNEAISRARALFPKEQFPNGDRELATILNRHAAILASLGDLEMARRCVEEGLKMRRHFCAATGSADDSRALATSLSPPQRDPRPTGRLGCFGEVRRKRPWTYSESCFPRPTFPTVTRNSQSRCRTQLSCAAAVEIISGL